MGITFSRSINVSDMNTFLLEIHDMRVHLRELRVQDPCGWNTGKHDYPRVLDSLWTATNLEHISFNCLCVGSSLSQGGDRIQIKTLVDRHIIHFLRRWHEVNNGNVLDVVQFVGHTKCRQCEARSRSCRYGTGETVQEVSDTFKSMIAAELRLPVSPRRVRARV